MFVPRVQLASVDKLNEVCCCLTSGSRLTDVDTVATRLLMMFAKLSDHENGTTQPRVVAVVQSLSYHYP
jgi:hypothetical protein